MLSDEDLKALRATFGELDTANARLHTRIEQLNQYIDAVGKRLSERQLCVTSGVCFKVVGDTFVLSWERFGNAREWGFTVRPFAEMAAKPSDEQRQTLVSASLHVRAAAAKVLPAVVQSLLAKTEEVCDAVTDAIPELMLRDNTSISGDELGIAEEPRRPLIEEEPRRPS